MFHLSKVVIDSLYLGVTTAVARALHLTIFNLSQTQNNSGCLFTFCKKDIGKL